jgi:hypothetical protein
LGHDFQPISAKTGVKLLDARLRQHRRIISPKITLYSNCGYAWSGFVNSTISLPSHANQSPMYAAEVDA